MEFDICLNGSPVGTLQIRQEGLYEIVTAECAAARGVFRLYAETENAFDVLGVPVPENGKLILRKRVPIGRLPKSENAVFFLSVQEPWTPFSGRIAGIDISDVCSRTAGNAILYCESVQTPRPLALLPFFRQCRPYCLYGQRAIILCLPSDT